MKQNRGRQLSRKIILNQKKTRCGHTGCLATSSTFCCYDFIQNIFKIGVAIVDIANIIQNAGPILAMAAI